MQKNEVKEALHECRQEVKKEKENQKLIGYVTVEILIISSILGYYFNSWVVFGASCIVLNICYFIPYIGIILSLGLSAIWGYLGWMLLGYISPTVGIVGGIIAFLISVGIHIGPKLD